MNQRPPSSILPLLDRGVQTGIVEPFADRVRRHCGTLTRVALTGLQINLGKLCNQTCSHCHVEAGPTRTRENMSAPTAERVVALAADCASLGTVDLTGGAPELNLNFRMLVTEFRGRGWRVIDRCNLTVLSEPGQEGLGRFLAEQGVDVVASLPCYLEANVDAQRGSGVFNRSLAGLTQLNELGFGREGSGLRLDLVYNPTGSSLPPEQSRLESDYKRQLKARYGIEFNHLLTITNIPIKRYARFLLKRDRLQAYMELLADNFNPLTTEGVMCRSLISIGWDGSIYDCDFNQMLEIPAGGVARQTVWNIDSFADFLHQRIAVADHCYGCTAAAGSGCGGALVSLSKAQ
jgi:radical SAM/Cys-rich protein